MKSTTTNATAATPRTAPLVCPHGCKPCSCGSGDPACLCWDDHAKSATEAFVCGCTEEKPCHEHAR